MHSEEFVLVGLPQAVGENLNFVETAKPRSFHPRTNLPNPNNTLTHQSTIVEHIFHVHFPVTDVKSKQVTMLAAASAFVFQIWIPPEMKDIHCDPDMGRIESLGKVVSRSSGYK